MIAPSVKLIKAGREWKACCPFHNEKTPSFTVNDEKGFYHCFGCGAHGDAIRFLTDQRGLPFMDAVKELAAKAGMDVPAPDPQAQERAERAVGADRRHGRGRRWFAEQLQGIDGAEARDYLKQPRDRRSDRSQRFGIGLAPDSRTALKRALAQLGEDKLIETGMLIQPEEGGKSSYDRFRGRLMIPIRDPRGRVIAFGGRILGDGEPKYLNSPDTPLFDKGRTLYNLDRAGPASRTAKRLIVVEGYMDVIGLDRAGIAEVVAPNGTAVTEAPARAHVAARPGADPVLRRRQRRAEGRDPRRAARPAPPRPRAHPALRRAARRARIPTTSSAPAAARRSRRCSPTPEPLDRAPVAPRGRRRAADHARGPRRPSPAPDRPCQRDRRPGARQLYRDEWLQPLRRRDRARSAQHRARRRSAARHVPEAAASSPPEPPRRRQRARHRRERHRRADRPRAAPRLHQFPRGAAGPLRAARRAPDRRPGTAQLRDELVNAAFSGAALDRDALTTILARRSGSDLGGTLARARWAFPSPAATATRTAPRSDLAAAVEIIAGGGGSRRRRLEAATERLKRDMTDEAFEEQQRLIAGAAGIEAQAGVARRHRLSGRNMAHGEKRNSAKSRHDRGGRCAADRPQRRVDQETDRPRQEARRHHL